MIDFTADCDMLRIATACRYRDTRASCPEPPAGAGTSRAAVNSRALAPLTARLPHVQLCVLGLHTLY